MKDLIPKSVSVLLVDDDEDDYVIIKRIFSKIPNSPFTLHWCSSYNEAKKLVKSADYDIFLIDYRLGANTGLDLLEIAEPNKRSEPFILLTGAGDSSIAQKSMHLAAADYIVKSSLKPDTLSRSLYYAMGRKQIEGQRLQHYIELNRTKDEFISLASHQLRTPATGVKQYVGMLLEGMAGELTEFQQQLLEKAYESNERQLAIVSDLLKVAQLDAGKVKLRKKPVDIVAVVTDAVKEQAATYKTRQQTVTVTTESERITTEVDPQRMRMVIDNLLDNASKYSEIGKHINVSVKETDQLVIIAITDEGVGISEEDQVYLFEKFSRIFNHLSDHVGGTGLGLYWAKKIVDLHDGLIKVESEAGEGTTFSVCLPKSLERAMLDNESSEGESQ